MYKNNSQNSSKFKGCSPLQLHRKLKKLSFAIGYYSYTNRSASLIKKQLLHTKNTFTQKNVNKKSYYYYYYLILSLYLLIILWDLQLFLYLSLLGL